MTPQEASSNTTSIERGLAFGSYSGNHKMLSTQLNQIDVVAYQSNIGLGFHFLQKNWANNVGSVFRKLPALLCINLFPITRFFFNKIDPTPGFDPIIGANAGQPRFVHGLDPTNSSRSITLVTDFVESRGGEYFFSPSISALATVFSS